MTDSKKRGEHENTKTWSSRERNSFLVETKSIFHDYLGAFTWWQNEK